MNEEQKNTLKAMLLKEKERLQQGIIKSREDRPTYEPGESVTELSLYDNHPGDLGTEMFDRLKDHAIEEHAESQIDLIDEALKEMESGQYGICRVCGKSIPLERLEVLPYTLYCVEHTPQKKLPQDRPVEEELLPLHGPDFSSAHNPQYDQRDDTFEEIANFGTSETPSDIGKDKDNYDELYEKDTLPEGFTEEYESFIGNEMDGERRIFPNKAEEELERQLDEEQLESQIGNIPYKMKDGYINEK